MNVIYTAKASADLDAIWLWNRDNHGVAHADDYVAFLRRMIDALPTSHRRGRAIPGRADLQFTYLRRRPRGHGHLAGYGMSGSTISVFHVFHSAQDWQRSIAR